MEPNPVYNNEIIEISRRTEGRQFFMRPDAEMEQLSRYLVAYYANYHGLVLFAVCFMSDHYHIVALDPLGRRAHFTRDLNRSLSRYTNRLRQRVKRAFWDGEGPFYGRIRDPETLLERIAYVGSNPVRHGAVNKSADWPGTSIGPAQWGVEMTVPLPQLISCLTTAFPPTITFMLKAPEAIPAAEVQGWTARCFDAIARREAEALELLGPSRFPPGAAETAPVTTAATDPVSVHTGPKPMAFGSTPLRKAVRKQIYAFRAAYSRARITWLEGRLRTVFPAGTQAMAARFTRVTPVTPDPLRLPFPYG